MSTSAAGSGPAAAAVGATMVEQACSSRRLVLAETLVELRGALMVVLEGVDARDDRVRSRLVVR